MLLLGHTGGRPSTGPPCLDTRGTLSGMGVEWLMGKGQGWNIFGVKIPPPTRPHYGNAWEDTDGVAFAHRGVAGPRPQSPGQNAEVLRHL